MNKSTTISGIFVCLLMFSALAAATIESEDLIQIAHDIENTDEQQRSLPDLIPRSGGTIATAPVQRHGTETVFKIWK